MAGLMKPLVALQASSARWHQTGKAWEVWRDDTMAILILALKYIGWLIAIILLAIAIILALPVSLTAACALTIESNLEQALDLLDEEDLDNIGLFLYDGSLMSSVGPSWAWLLCPCRVQPVPNCGLQGSRGT